MSTEDVATRREPSGRTERIRTAVTREQWRIRNRWMGRKTGEVPDGEVPAFHASMGASWRRIGLYALLVGDREAATDRFTKSAAHYVRSVRESRGRRGSLGPTAWRVEPRLSTDAVYAAVLARHWEMMGVAARTARLVNDAYTRRFETPLRHCEYYRASFLGAVLTGYDADEPLRNLRDTVGALRPERRPRFEACATAFEGINAASPGTVEQGIRALLSAHDRAERGDVARPRDLVCYPACALYRLALDRGLSVDVESPAIPAAVTE